jgi:hypothetical protein
MNRKVPRSPKVTNVRRVPPIAVEIAVSKHQNFSRDVHQPVEVQIEED